MTTVTTDEIVAFVLHNYKLSRTWKIISFFSWVSWMQEHGFCLTIADGDKLAAVLFVRPVMHAEQADNEPFYFDNEGDSIFVDIAIAAIPRKRAMQAFAIAVKQRFGLRDKLIRRDRDNPLVVKDLKKYYFSVTKKNPNLNGQQP